jgi:hypothetical protein
VHALKHAVQEQTQQQQQSSQHAYDCEQCLSYAQLGGGLRSDYLSFDFLSSDIQNYTFQPLTFFTRHTLAE